MKRKLYILVAAITLGSLFLCEPDDSTSLPAVALTPETLQFSVVQNPTNNNEVKVKNLDSTVIPYWSYSNVNGEMGHYNTNEQSIFFAFAGTYTIDFTAYTPGGAVYAKPVTVKVNKNDPTVFSDPRWALLTNGALGKTWIVNMVTQAPFAFAGSNYINTTVEGDWSWFPSSINDVSWSGIENKNWGEITFSLNGDYNVKIVQTSLTTGSNAQTTTQGTFSFPLTAGSVNDRVVFNGGLQMLHTNVYDGQTMAGFTFSNVRLIELTANTLKYSIIRNDGVQVVMNLIPKTAN
jgi:hypothetical protein